MPKMEIMETNELIDFYLMDQEEFRFIKKLLINLKGEKNNELNRN